MADHPKRGTDHASSEFFIGSSREALDKGIAGAFHQELTNRQVAAKLWSEGVFKPSDFTLNSLERALDRFLNALIILSPDDVTHIRKKKEKSARDNAIFEYGLFVGRHGRESVYFAIPDSVPMRIPTDFDGMTAVTYKIITDAHGNETYDVKDACDQILASLASSHSPTIRRPPSPFWDELSDSIFIVYGIHAEVGIQPHPRHRVSQRDLEAASALQGFLDRRYPHKHVRQVAATASGWDLVKESDADLVVVGGFVTNAIFAKHRARYERSFRLKLGRLCIVEGQQVLHPQFVAPPGCSGPDISDPQKVEDYATEHTTRDFGFVFNGVLSIYGRERRVIAIAGVKGHGTSGAARYVTDDRSGIDSLLREPLEHGDSLELAVAVDVDSDSVNSVEPISVLLNEQPLFPAVTKYAKSCELNRLCEGCTFGVPSITAHRLAALPTMLRSQIRAIVFDLDDTLIDTFGTLITLYEMKAAEAMIAQGAANRDATTLAATLLSIRRSAPSNFESELRRHGHFPKKALAARDRVFKNVELDHLVLSPEIAQLLTHLSRRFRLCLLTSGSREFQKRKIDKLEISRHFSQVEIVPESSRRAKAAAIQAMAEKLGLRPENVLVVGNRLDTEIAAGNALGMPTVWIQHGEGSDQHPSRETGQPDYTLKDVLEIETLLA